MIKQAGTLQKTKGRHQFYLRPKSHEKDNLAFSSSTEEFINKLEKVESLPEDCLLVMLNLSLLSHQIIKAKKEHERYMITMN